VTWTENSSKHRIGELAECTLSYYITFIELLYSTILSVVCVHVPCVEQFGERSVVSLFAGSTFFILYAYYYYLCGSYATSAILGMVALIFRQTNIIWVFFMALCNVCRNLHRYVTFNQITLI